MDSLSADRPPRSVPGTELRILTLTFSRDDLRFDWRHLTFGLVCTWIAGIGRYWDHPDPHPLQIAGAGSLIYVVCLTTLLWCILAPLRLRGLSWLHLLALISLTAPPAILYAIPVERFMSLPAAQSANLWFLGIVAIWRVVIYLRYLVVYLEASLGVMIVAGFLPLTGIVFALTVLNLEQAVFQIMGGMRGGPPPTGADRAYGVLFLLTYLSMFLAPALLIVYLGLVVGKASEKPGEAPSESE